MPQLVAFHVPLTRYRYQPAHFASQSWTQGIFFLLGHWSYLGAVFFTSGVQLLLQVFEGGGRDRRSPLALCVGLAALVPGAGSGTLLNDWNHGALPSHLLQKQWDVLASSQVSQGWRAHEPQGLLCVRSAVPAVRTVRDNPASSQHKMGSFAKGNLLKYVLVLKSIY